MRETYVLEVQSADQCKGGASEGNEDFILKRKRKEGRKLNGKGSYEECWELPLPSHNTITSTKDQHKLSFLYFGAFLFASAQVQQWK